MVAKGCKGTNRRRPAVREIPSAVRSSEKEQSSLCEVATIEDADTVLLTTFQSFVVSSPRLCSLNCAGLTPTAFLKLRLKWNGSG